MNKIILQQIWIISSVILATVTGCNFPGRSNSTPSLDVTQAYQTVEAQLTQAASLTPKKEKITPTLKETSGVTPSATLEISATITPSQTSPSATGVTKLCDQSSPGVPIDVTIPDDTEMGSRELPKEEDPGRKVRRGRLSHKEKRCYSQQIWIKLRATATSSP